MVFIHSDEILDKCSVHISYNPSFNPLEIKFQVMGKLLHHCKTPSETTHFSPIADIAYVILMLDMNNRDMLKVCFNTILKEFAL